MSPVDSPTVGDGSSSPDGLGTATSSEAVETDLGVVRSVRRAMAGPKTPVDGRSPDLGRQRSDWKIPDGVFIAAMLVAVAALVAFSLASRPTASATAPWWPAAGIALGLGIRFPNRYLWVLALAVAAVTLPVVLWAGRPPLLAIAVTVGVAIEMVIGTLLLRGRQDRSPTLSTPRDLVKFFLAVAAAAILNDLFASGCAWLLGDPAGALERLLTTAPTHAAGMFLLTPLFMDLSRRSQHGSRVELAAQVLTALGVAALVFSSDLGTPLAFLLYLPPVWAALRMSTRSLFLVMWGVALIASLSSVSGHGPFSFERLGPTVGAMTLQLFQVSMVIVFLALSLVVGSERQTSLRLYETEELFRKNFESSVAGKLMLIRGPSRWIVERSNLSARELLPGLMGAAGLDALLGPVTSGVLIAAADSLTEGHVRLTLPLADGRSLDASLAILAERPDGTLFVLQFQDVTESLRMRQFEQEELNRAAEVQRALRPDALPETAGWAFGTTATPANRVSGDFYDVRVRGTDAVISLGDVMGKGMDAGMLAAATRAVLRSHDESTSPLRVIFETARVLDTDLRRTSAFLTLAYVLVDLESADFRFVDAGHGLHFISRAASGLTERLVSKDMPMGLGARWIENSGTLAPGDTILLVSDGVLDLYGGTVEQLQDAITECVNRDGNGVQAFVEELCAEASSLGDDDVTAVAMRRTS